jgi:hypothetical protein
MLKIKSLRSPTLAESQRPTVEIHFLKLAAESLFQEPVI